MNIQSRRTSEFRKSFDKIFRKDFRLWLPENVVCLPHWWELATSLFQNFVCHQKVTLLEFFNAWYLAIIVLIVWFRLNRTCIILGSIDSSSLICHLDQILDLLASMWKVCVKNFVFASDQLLTGATWMLLIETNFHEPFQISVLHDCWLRKLILEVYTFLLCKPNLIQVCSQQFMDPLLRNLKLQVDNFVEDLWSKLLVLFFNLLEERGLGFLTIQYCLKFSHAFLCRLWVIPFRQRLQRFERMQLLTVISILETFIILSGQVRRYSLALKFFFKHFDYVCDGVLKDLVWIVPILHCLALALPFVHDVVCCWYNWVLLDWAT